MIRIFNYPGCKVKFVPQIAELASSIDDKVNAYIEPFCGTASVLLNYGHKFPKLAINDLSRDVITIINAFKFGKYQMLVDMYQHVTDEFGSIKESKESYYNFRNTYNSRYYGTDTIEEGFFLYMASRAAINSLFRVGPNGFNQSFGNRADTLGMVAEEFDSVKEILGRTKIMQGDYTNTFAADRGDALFFIDPPYIDRKVQGSYKDEKYFDQEYFLDNIKSLEGYVIYTDVLSDYISESLGWNHVVLSEKKNVSPGRNQGGSDYVEVAYYNF